LSGSTALFVDRFPRRAVLLDSNLPLLVMMGSYDPRLIASFKRLNEFSLRDYEILALLVSEFQTLVSTPHVPTEVDGLVNNANLWKKPEVYDHLALGIQKFEERHISATDLASMSEFRIFGLADAALSLIAKETLLVTNDGRLSSHPQRNQLFAASLAEIRAIYRREG